MKLVSYSLIKTEDAGDAGNPFVDLISKCHIMAEVKPGYRTITALNVMSNYESYYLNFPWMYFLFDFDLYNKMNFRRTIYCKGVSLYLSDDCFPNSDLVNVDFVGNLHSRRSDDKIHGNYVCLGDANNYLCLPNRDLKSFIQDKIDLFFWSSFVKNYMRLYLQKNDFFRKHNIFYEYWQNNPNFVLDKLIANKNAPKRNLTNNLFAYKRNIQIETIAEEILNY